MSREIYFETILFSSYEYVKQSNSCISKMQWWNWYGIGIAIKKKDIGKEER